MIRAFIERHRLAVREARFVRASLLLSAGMNLLEWTLTLWFVLPRLATSSFFALHYTVYFGIDRIGPPWMLLTAPSLGFAILLMNGWVAARLFPRDRLAASFVAALTILLEALLLAVALLTVLLNL